MSFLGRGLLKSLSHFFNSYLLSCFGLFAIKFRSSSYILGHKTLSNMWIENIFPILWVTFSLKRLFLLLCRTFLVCYYTPIFLLFFFLSFSVISKKSLPRTKPWSFPLRLPSRSFIISVLMFKFLIYFELDFFLKIFTYFLEK